MATTAPVYSDDKIVVDPSDDTQGDSQSQSSATVINSPWSDKVVSPHDEKIASDLNVAPSDGKLLADDPTSGTTTSTEKQAIPSPNAPTQKIPASPSATVVAPPTPSEKIPAVEPDLPRRAFTTTTTTSSTRRRLLYRELTFHHTSSLKLNHNVVVDPNNVALYLVAVSGFAKGREDVVLHAISEGSAAAAKGAALTAEEGKQVGEGVAFAQFPYGRKGVVVLGLGKGERMGEVRWFELKEEEEGWSLVLGEGEQGGDAKIRLVAGGGEAGGGGEGEDSRATAGSFRFVDSRSSVTMAVYMEQKVLTSWKKRGKLRIYDEELNGVDVLGEEDMERLVVLCCAVLNEKRRRKTVRKWAGMGVI